jgi:hypothetical protein
LKSELRIEEKMPLQIQIELIAHICPTCGIVYAIPGLYSNMELSKIWYCPNGHCTSNNPADLLKLQNDRDFYKQQSEMKVTKIQSMTNQIAGYKAVITKLKNKLNA